METEDNASKMYSKIIKLIFPKSEDVPHFNWRMNCFEDGIFDKLVDTPELNILIEEFIKKIPATGVTFVGDNHGTEWVSLENDGGDIIPSYFNNWEFSWEEFGGKERTFYRELASLDDCTKLLIKKKPFYFSDLASIQSAVLLWNKQREFPLNKVLKEPDCDLLKLEERIQKDLALKMLVIGTLASFKNDRFYYELYGPSRYALPNTNKRTDEYTGTGDNNSRTAPLGYMINPFYTGDSPREKVWKQMEKMKKDRKKFELIKFVPKLLQKEKYSNEEPNRSPRVFYGSNCGH
ncbi:MAG: hypothetical protein PHD81_01545 [Candidatus Nanoarchaeia archaeon]|nr:hypothetical protein [Candidatus Nanoarchaeia archaeon]MDD5587772.1 hypothetical protein [Candidatus Nanoarchaeia archaeon]